MTHYSIGKLATIACLYFACTDLSAGSCASKELHEAEVAMKAAYHQVLEQITDRNERKWFIASQKAWRKTRDESVDLMARQQPCRKTWLLYKTELTRERAEMLECMVAALVEADLVPDSLTMKSSPLRQSREMWESQELQYCHSRFAVSAATDVNDPGMGIEAQAFAAQLPILGLAKGGTQPSGAMLTTEQVDLRLLHKDIPLPPADPSFTAQVTALLGQNIDRYGIA